MFLDITRAIQNPGTEFPFTMSEEVAAQDILGEQVTFEKAAISGFFSSVGGKIFVRGRLSTTAYALCANCLAPAKAPIEVLFQETFIQKMDVPDEEAFIYEGSKLDFADMALSLSVLALPMRFLCKEDCQGFCGVCGKDMEHCTCQKENQQRHPFEKLQQMLLKDEEV
jgi:Predicted metal-binding, possibly nucleic acid-binding protein